MTSATPLHPTSARPLYSQLLDPVRCSPDDQDLALPLLKLQALAGTPVLLSSTNAISSAAILSADCAGSEGFLKLVKQRRIQFIAWTATRDRPACGPREAMRCALSDPKYRFSGWPDEINTDPEMRLQVLNCFADPRATIGDDRFDGLIRRAKALFEAAGPKPTLPPAGTPQMTPRFKSYMQEVSGFLADASPEKEELWDSGIPHKFTDVVERLEAADEWNRSAAYAITDKICRPALAADIKEWIDEPYNRAYAESLGCRLATICRLSSWTTYKELVPPDAKPCRVVLEKPPHIFTEQETKDARRYARPLSWEEIEGAFRIGKAIREDGTLDQQQTGPVADLLADRYTKARVGNADLILAGLSTVGAAALVSGGLFAEAMVILRFYAGMNKVLETATTRIRRDAATCYRGYVGRGDWTD